MVMDKLGKQVSDYPKATIIIIIIISFLAFGSIQYFGLDQEFSEESFLPDMEIAQASDEISDDYTSVARVPILVKSKNNDVLTSSSLVEILQVEKDILNDSKIVSTLDVPS
jgi:predicted RND superfamily exporter protein